MPKRIFPPLLAIPESRANSPGIERALVDSAFAQRQSLVVGGLAMLLVGLLVWLHSGKLWMLGWTLASAATLVGRLSLARAYHARAEPDCPYVWARRFTIGAWASGALWGLINLVIVTEHDPLINLVVISVESGYLSGAVARNNVLPAAAHGQILLTLGMMAAACIATLQLPYIVFCGFILLHVLSSRSTMRFLSRQTTQLLVAGADNERLLARLAATNDDLARANGRLAALANTDALTGLANRRGFDEALAREWRAAQRAHASIALLLIDIDHFKAFNDTLGHPRGDECLRFVAAALAAELRRPEDVVARHGGEEFVAVLPQTDLHGAALVAERVRAAIAALAIPHPACALGYVTVSVGAVALVPAGDAAMGDLVALADAALYGAKASGRNRVLAATSEPAVQPPPASMVRMVPEV